MDLTAQCHLLVFQAFNSMLSHSFLFFINENLNNGSLSMNTDSIV